MSSHKKDIKAKKKNKLDELVSLMEKLRSPDGCPWDREQTYKTLVPFIIEEAYEVISAIDAGSPDMLKEELGDLLFQIIFLCQISREKNGFDIYDVLSNTFKKMVRRHPHVFGEKIAATSKDVLLHWNRIKNKEKGERGESGCLTDIPEHLPSLMRAHKVSERVSKLGFDWKEVENVFCKVDEELYEFKAAWDKRDAMAMEEEFGDILFTLVNVSRFIEINPEDALRKTVGKFIKRFHCLEAELKKRGKSLEDVSQNEIDKLWEMIKNSERVSS